MTTETATAHPRSILPRVAREIGPSWPKVLGAFLVSLASTPLMLLTPIPLKIVVDSVIGSKPLPGFIHAITPRWFLGSWSRVLVFTVILQLLIVVLSDTQELASYVLSTRAGEQMTLAFRAKLFRHIQRLSILLHDARGTSDSVYRVQYDASSLQYLTTDGVIPLFGAMFTLILTIWIIARLDWQLALVALGVTPILYGLGRWYNSRMRPRYMDVHKIESDAMRVVAEALSALRVVKAFGREDAEHDRFVTRSGRGAQARIRLAFSEGLFGLAVNAATAIGTALVLYIGVRNVKSGTLTLGELLMIIAYLRQLYDPLRTISRKVAGLQSHLAGAERVFEVLDELPDVPEDPEAIELDATSGTVEFLGVSFAYQDGHTILHDVSLSVDSGSCVGIAGRTGAGKTTLMGLLTRLFDPTAGCIRLDGHDIRRYKVADLRRQFAVVSQDPVLFSTSIAENIAYARSGASHDDVVQAAIGAAAHDFIQTLPEGYDTLVGERGMRLSGGERQRIAIARAFLKDAPILILDEPTSSVDTRTEGAIMEAMERLMVGRTTFMIAHRLSTLRGCDIRVEVQDGTVVQTSQKADPRPHTQHRVPPGALATR
jgi:ATP-binding cassette, subfamily B, bacterial